MHKNNKHMHKKLIRLTPTQTGLSLIELMIGSVVGLIVIAGVTKIYLTTVAGSSDVLQQSKLNQEMAALMSIMSNDIRRSGIWGNPDFNNPETNPFSADGTTVLTVVTNMSGTGVTINPSATNASWGDDSDSITSGSCILYSYDDPGTTPGNVDAGDLRGFRLTTTGVVQMLNNGSGFDTHADNCKDSYWTDTDDWLDLNDNTIINVTDLTFELVNSVCLNTSEPNSEDEVHSTDADTDVDDADEIDCYAVTPSSGEVTTETRQVDISITAILTNDTSTRVTLDQTIRVRNDLVTEH